MPQISVARFLWWYGEDALVQPLLDLPAETIADLGDRAGELMLAETLDRLWPGVRHTSGAWMVLAAIEHFEGALRPGVRTRRRPTKAMPEHLVRTEAELWAALQPVKEARRRRDSR
ncbi:hypothetical protein [Curtobacterium sp. MCBD17_040]|uniref:hypothetical protein n=1 Tax=Curtobacterium sp. MCBD17_040 TaxID=2175674 RepID=UPI0011B47E3F|nr:hypothetical protein [Curtobacterium sp. MCBD17_040]WIB65758.1 hypothetical protein DEI94_16705 [Curtobacterium sp. MCBD17_040]